MEKFLNGQVKENEASKGKLNRSAKTRTLVSRDTRESGRREWSRVPNSAFPDPSGQ